MKLELVTFKTYPSKKDKFWQIVLLPTISVLGNEEDKDEYSRYKVFDIYKQNELKYKSNIYDKDEVEDEENEDDD